MNEEKKIEIPAKFKDLIATVEKMSVLDLNELVKTLEAHFGVSASAVAVAGPSVIVADVEKKSSFKVELTEVGAQKIAVIKIIKEALGLGLGEAKNLVDNVPSLLKEEMKDKDAEDLKKKIEEAGGKVKLM
ncbi:MAG: 50S ribosomal protein L7/L12 [bacterium]